MGAKTAKLQERIAEVNQSLQRLTDSRGDVFFALQDNLHDKALSKQLLEIDAALATGRAELGNLESMKHAAARDDAVQERAAKRAHVAELIATVDSLTKQRTERYSKIDAILASLGPELAAARDLSSDLRQLACMAAIECVGREAFANNNGHLVVEPAVGPLDGAVWAVSDQRYADTSGIAGARLLVRLKDMLQHLEKTHREPDAEAEIQASRRLHRAGVANTAAELAAPMDAAQRQAIVDARNG